MSEFIMLSKEEIFEELTSIVKSIVAEEVSKIKIPDPKPYLPEYVSTNEAMKILNCSKTKLWYLRKGIRIDQDQNGNQYETKVKQLPSYRNGKRILYKYEDLEKFIEN